MPIEDMSEVVMIPARRVRVSTDLGMVREGDHVLIVGNVVISLDTSRMPPKSDTAISEQRRTSTRKITAARLTANHIREIVREFGPISSINISDKLGFERSDNQGRGKVTRLLQKMCSDQSIARYQDQRIRQFRYHISSAEPAKDDNDPASLQRVS